MKKIITLLLLIVCAAAYGQSLSVAKDKVFSKGAITFIENKGQITDQYGNSRKDIQYKTGNKGMSIFVGNGQLHYQWSRQITKRKEHWKCTRHLLEKPDTTAVKYSMYRLDMQLEGANTHAEVIVEDKQQYYETYHTTALHTDYAKASTYNRVTYKNIYPNIDWVLYIKDNKLEYDFIVNPGGNASNIKMKYRGATDIAKGDKNVKITTPFGSLNEENLYAYEQATGKPIAASFSRNKNIFGFSLAALNDKNATIVIDPTLTWGTYYGGDGEDESYNMTCSSAGIISICGATTSIGNIATTGAYQTVCNGSYDAFLARFNSAGTLLWATYYGGEKEDDAYAVACDNEGNAYLTGITYSSHYIATTGSYQTIFNGRNDAFFAKFNTSGILQWATYYGGSIGTEGEGVSCDNSNDIYITGYTASDSGIATIRSYQDTLGGNGNAYLAKFNNIGSLIWATYFGLSSGGSSGVSCICDRQDNVYIAGDVGDTGIYATPDCYKSSDGYGDHGFVAKFDSSCHLLWSTYFGGDSTDYIFGMSSDDSANVYITGLTNSNTGIATTDAYQTTYAGGYYDAFLAKFNHTGTLQWSTYYGGSSDDEGNGITCDTRGNVYITGITGSGNGITTIGAWQAAIGGGADAFLAKFSGSGSLSWATYYGGSRNDGGYGVGCDGVDNIYMAGGTASTDNIATSGSYQSTFADSSDAFLVKFDTATTNIRQVTTFINHLSLYPSPNTGSFTVVADFTMLTNVVSIAVLTLCGQIVYSDMATLQNGILRKQININVPDGTYFLQLKDGEKKKVIKFLIE
jgi:hypothetical protein